MAYVSLYRKFRPDTFDKVVEQSHIVKTLINQIKRDKIGHAYLFTGTRGTGKTSLAKIFARAVNCLNPVNGSPCGVCENCVELAKPSNIDIVEMDAASNNGVDEIRQLKENAQYRPSHGKYKVYIIDEVHMLSPSAFNALLKTLEEPPEFVIFILATTEVQKLPATILSRCMRFDFRLVSAEGITELLKRIFDESKITYEIDALKQIALRGEGSVRDALSIAEMCVSYAEGKVTLEAVNDVLGASDFSSLHELGTAILQGETGKALTILEKLYREGRSSLQRDLSNYFCNLLSVKNIGDSLSAGEREKELLKQNLKFDNYRIIRALEIISGIETELRYSSQPRLLLEAAVARASEMRLDESVEGLISRLKAVEEKVKECKTSAISESAVNEIKAALTKGDTQAKATIPEEKAIPKEAEKAAVEVKKYALADDKDKPDAEAENPLINFSGLTKVDEAPIFEEAPSDNLQAEMLWENAIRRLNASNKKLIASTANDVTEVRLEGKTFTAFCKNKYVYSMLLTPNYLNGVKEALMEEMPDIDYRVELITEKDLSESIRTLEELSGGRLIKK